jgi:hypothetical protein
MKVIENYETVDVYLAYVGVTTKDFEINLDFTPDEMILKNVSKYDFDAAIDGNTSDAIIFLKTDLINSPTLCHFPRSVGFHETYDIPFKINKSINGKYRFFLTRSDNKEPTNKAVFNTFIALTLLFIKYK